MTSWLDTLKMKTSALLDDAFVKEIAVDDVDNEIVRAARDPCLTVEQCEAKCKGTNAQKNACSR
jgi:hypothetical protein